MKEFMEKFGTMLPLFLVAFIIYFMIMRPQQKKMKEHQEKLKSLKKGDRVIVSGMVGVIQALPSDQEVDIKVGSDTVIRFLRSAVADIVSNGTPTVGVSPAAKIETATKSEKSAAKKVGAKNTPKPAKSPKSPSKSSKK